MIIEKINIDLVDSMGSDLSVVNAARVSFNKLSTELTSKDERLINYLAENGHWSPFTHTSLTFRCKVPIFLARQLVKHQVGGNWNEVSRRYVDTEPTFYFPDYFHDRPDGSIKQGCGSVIRGDFNDSAIIATKALSEFNLDMYKNLMDMGVAPEEARMILPLNTMTEWIWTGSLLFFARVYNQRSDSHAQLVAQQFAQILHDRIPTKFQKSWNALTNQQGMPF